jgi:hypothetical protein
MNAEQFTKDKITILCAQARNPETVCAALRLPFKRGEQVLFVKTPELADPYRHWLPSGNVTNWRAVWREVLLERAAGIAKTLPERDGEIPSEPLDGVS